MIDVGNAYFCCDECPIAEDVERRYRNADETGVFNMIIADVIKLIFLFSPVDIVKTLSVKRTIANKSESVRPVKHIEERCV